MGKRLIPLIYSFLFANLILATHKNGMFAEDKKAFNEWKQLLKKSPLPNDNSQLRMVYRIGDEGQISPEIYLKFPWKMAFKGNDILYVTDWGGDKVIKFKLNGDFISYFGKTGHGPNDLFRPSSLMIYGEYIVVNDSGNRRVVFFDNNGIYAKSFKIFKSYYEMVISDKGQIYAIPFFLIDKDKSELVDVLDEEGHLIRSFGQYPRGIPRLREAWGHISINPKKEEIYIAYSHFLWVQKYSTDGTLLSENRINHPAMEIKEEKNRQEIDRKGNPALFQVIDAIQAADDGFFLLITYPRTEFLQYDNEGRMLMDYWYSSPWDAGAGKDFVVRNVGHKKLFLLFYEKEYSSIFMFETK
jgi:hypothetical protein